MIYFDNAATSFFKPNTSILSFENANKFMSVNPGRSSHSLSKKAEELVFRSRKKLSNFFNNQHIERVVFTKNCTEALNLAIFGLYKPYSEVITTVTEHNSVLRPLYYLESQGKITLKIVEPKNEKITTEDILPLVNKNTSLVVLNAVSNVTGTKNDFEELGEKLPCPLILDGAQIAGHELVDMTKYNISVLCVAGHKGLYGAQGSGALIFNNCEIKPSFFGGSGSESFSKVPSCYPEILECGTLNLPAICSLFDGVSFAEQNLEQSKKRLESFTSEIIKELTALGAKVYSNKNAFGIVAFKTQTPSIELSEILDEKYQIATRGGFHCAPLMHKFLNTQDEGLVRVSLSPKNTENEVIFFIKAMKSLIKKGY